MFSIYFQKKFTVVLLVNLAYSTLLHAVRSRIIKEGTEIGEKLYHNPGEYYHEQCNSKLTKNCDTTILLSKASVCIKPSQQHKNGIVKSTKNKSKNETMIQLTTKQMHSFEKALAYYDEKNKNSKSFTPLQTKIYAELQANFNPTTCLWPKSATAPSDIQGSTSHITRRKKS